MTNGEWGGERSRHHGYFAMRFSQGASVMLSGALRRAKRSSARSRSIPTCIPEVVKRVHLPWDRNDGQHDLRGVRRVVKYANVSFSYFCTVHFRLSTLEVAGETRSKAAGDLQADAMSLQKHIAGNQVLQ